MCKTDIGVWGRGKVMEVRRCAKGRRGCSPSKSLSSLMVEGKETIPMYLIYKLDIWILG